VGHRALTPRARRLAAVLAGGADAVLSHRSAAQVHGLVDRAPARHEITAPDRRRHRGAELVVYRNRLHPADRTVVDGVPITTVARTLVDLAATRSADELDAALEAAARQRVLDLRAIDETIARNRRRRGVGRLAAAVERLHPAAQDTRSRLEARALALIARHDLPAPAVNVLVEGLEVDLLWPHARLAVELDSRQHHMTPQAFERDRARDARLATAGYRTLRFTWRQLADEPQTVVAALRAALPAAHRPATPPQARAAAAA
ncbi:MAG TPA: DUF559 domain-containing protein, partial [Capillimicrobium sp.]|nr:DUF559 domain-containing protein [Capillimicrobium sp.]